MRGDKMNYTIKNQDLLLEISNHGAEIKVIKYQNIEIFAKSRYFYLYKCESTVCNNTMYRFIIRSTGKNG